jgi:hypothetical protein
VVGGVEVFMVLDSEPGNLPGATGCQAGRPLFFDFLVLPLVSVPDGMLTSTCMEHRCSCLY